MFPSREDRKNEIKDFQVFLSFWKNYFTFKFFLFSCRERERERERERDSALRFWFIEIEIVRIRVVSLFLLCDLKSSLFIEWKCLIKIYFFFLIDCLYPIVICTLINHTYVDYTSIIILYIIKLIGNGFYI